MPEEMEMNLSFELPEELEGIDLQNVGEQTVATIAKETLQKRTNAHNKRVLEKTKDMEGKEKASFIMRRFVKGLRNVKVNQPGTPYKDVLNGEVITRQTKGYSVSCNREYANGKVGRDIHYPLSI